MCMFYICYQFIINVMQGVVWQVLLGRELFDALFLVELANEQRAILFGNDVTVKSLHDDTTALRRVNDAVGAVEHGYITYGSIAASIVLDVGVQRSPCAEVAPTEVGRMDKDGG